MATFPVLHSRGRSALSGLTTALALLLGGAVLWAVVVELRSQRRTTERVREDYLTLLAHERIDAASSALTNAATTALGAQLSGTMGSVYDELPPPVPRGGAGNVLRCIGEREPTPTYFRIDLRDGGFLASAGSSDSVVGWVRDVVVARMRTGPPSAGAYHVAAAHGQVAIYGGKYAPYQAPVAVYGVVTCARTIATLLDDASGRRAVDSLVSLRAIAGDDTILEYTGVAPALVTSDLGGIQLSAYPASAQSLAGIVVTRGVVPPIALTLMLIGTIALAVIAVMQIVRDRRAVRAQAELVTTISHELRTPLAQILLYSETLALGRVHGDDATQAVAQRIVDEARRLGEIVTNVVSLARAETASPGVAAVAPAIESAISGVRALSDARATVEVSVSGTPRVRARESALRQALTNVLDNALKFGPPAQTVRVSAERVGATVRITVEDEGPGIPATQRERIWTRYVRAARDGESPGAGIGLSVVRDIVVGAGGRAWSEDAPNGGTRIVLELPAAEEA